MSDAGVRAGVAAVVTPITLIGDVALDNALRRAMSIATGEGR
jgi:hypothetical protein